MIGIKINKIAVGLGATLATWVILAGEAKAQNVRFPAVGAEVIGPSLQLTTRTIPFQTGSSSPFRVDKFINNQSGQSWNGFKIGLEVFENGVWGLSKESDGISFDQANLNWDNTVVVGINNNLIPRSDWGVVRENMPFDKVTFNFDNFVVSPGQTLYLGFDMLNLNQETTWRLQQQALAVSSAPVPEPSSILGMALLGAFGIASVLKRK